VLCKLSRALQGAALLTPHRPKYELEVKVHWGGRAGQSHLSLRRASAKKSLVMDGQDATQQQFDGPAGIAAFGDQPKPRSGAEALNWCCADQSLPHPHLLTPPPAAPSVCLHTQ
jgi:hypothetical protein